VKNAKQLTRSIILTIILLCGVVFIWSLNQNLFAKISLSFGSLTAIILLWMDVLWIATLIFSSFFISFSLFAIYFQLALPLWLIMILVLVIFGYFFLCFEKSLNLGAYRQRIYFIAGGLINLELFLGLNYFQISPLSKSMIMAAGNYFIAGYFLQKTQKERSSVKPYICLLIVIVLLIFLTSIWGV